MRRMIYPQPLKSNFVTTTTLHETAVRQRDNLPVAPIIRDCSLGGTGCLKKQKSETCRYDKIFHGAVMQANAKNYQPRASEIQLETATRSRGTVQPLVRRSKCLPLQFLWPTLSRPDSGGRPGHCEDR